MNKDRRVSSIHMGLWLTLLILAGVPIGPVATMAEPQGEIRIVKSFRPDINENESEGQKEKVYEDLKMG